MTSSFDDIILNTFDEDDTSLFTHSTDLLSLNPIDINNNILMLEEQEEKTNDKNSIKTPTDKQSSNNNNNLPSSSSLKRGRPRIIEDVSYLNKQKKSNEQDPPTDSTYNSLITTHSINSSLITKNDNSIFDIGSNVKKQISNEDMWEVYNRICKKPTKKKKRDDKKIRILYGDEEDEQEEDEETTSSHKKKKQKKNHNKKQDDITTTESYPTFSVNKQQYANPPKLKLPNSIKKTTLNNTNGSGGAPGISLDIDSRNPINYAKRLHSIKKHIHQTKNIDDKYKMWFISKSIVSNKYSLITPSLPKDDEDLDKCFENSKMFFKNFTDDLDKLSKINPKEKSDDDSIKFKHLSIIMADILSKLTPEKISIEVEDTDNIVYADKTRILDCSRGKHLDSAIKTAYINTIINGYKSKENMSNHHHPSNTLLKNNNFQSIETRQNNNFVQTTTTQGSTDFYKPSSPSPFDQSSFSYTNTSDDTFNEYMWENQMGQTGNNNDHHDQSIEKKAVDYSKFFIDIPKSHTPPPPQTPDNISSSSFEDTEKNQSISSDTLGTIKSSIEDYKNLLNSSGQDINSKFNSSLCKDFNIKEFNINIEQIITTNTKISITDKKTGALLITDKNKTSQISSTNNTFINL